MCMLKPLKLKWKHVLIGNWKILLGVSLFRSCFSKVLIVNFMVQSDKAEKDE